MPLKALPSWTVQVPSAMPGATSEQCREVPFSEGLRWAGGDQGQRKWVKTRGKEPSFHSVVNRFLFGI